MSPECPGRHVKMWRCLKMLWSIYIIWKKNSWLQLLAKTNDLQGVEWSLLSCLFFRMIRSFLYLKFWEIILFWGELLPKSCCSFISLQTKNFTAEESLDTQGDSRFIQEFFSDIRLYKQRLLEKSKPCCAFAFTVNAKTIIPPTKNRGKTVNEKK